MSAATLEVREADVQIKQIPLDLIFADEEFNCRGYIPPSEVVDLAKDIAEHGLFTPIITQPWDKVPGREFRIVAGHRRYAAVLLNRNKGVVCKQDPNYINAIVYHHLTDTQALVLNLAENIQRENLDLIQEAKAIARLRDAGLNQSEAARELKVSRPWMQMRYYVLDFPEDIQQTIKEGYITQQEIHQLHTMWADGDMDYLYAAVRKIKDAKIKAGTTRIKVHVAPKPKAQNLMIAKARKKHEIEILLEHLVDSGPVGIHTRALAWAAGNISTLDFLKDIKQYLKEEHDVNYMVPEQGIAGL